MALTDKLSAIGTAIREKTGKSELMTLDAMPDEIRGIETGGGGGAGVEPIELTGNCEYGCAGPLASAYIEANGDTITTKNISDASYMFKNSMLKTIPFKLNFKQCSGSYDATRIGSMFYGATNLQHIPDFDVKHADYYADCSYLFHECRSLEQVPYIYNAYPNSISKMFGYCYRLREIPEDYFDTWNFSQLNSYQYSYANHVFYYCYSLRSISPKLLSKLIGNETVNKYYSYVTYYSMCNNCLVLDELIDVPIAACELTSNALDGIVNSCDRLKNFTFETNEDGSSKTAKWNNQKLDLSISVGMASNASIITRYNSGITADKEVTDDATYQALKNDPDWFTTKTEYSRYNHDSAVVTINSLPDTSAYLASAGGTNTIKFKGAAGALTDGGAINTLTEEEIAVATAKGWTVSLG